MGSETDERVLENNKERDTSNNLPISDGGAPTDPERDSNPPEQEESSAAQDVPPDGGLQAWTQVAASWMIIFNTWGVINTFGDYQAYYESGQLFTASSSDISWIGSIQSFIVFATGALAGPVYDRGYLRVLLISGTFLMVFGHMMLSLCNTFWEAVLAQGFCIGVGGGLIFVPALAVVTPWFKARLGLAIGLAASGSSIGGIIYPVMLTRLIPEVGFSWAIRILGFTVLATLMVPIFFSKMKSKPAKSRALLDMTAFKDGPFMLCVFACFLGYAGIYVGFFYIPYFAQAQKLWTFTQSLYLVCILNAGSVFGRTLPNWLSDRIGPVNIVFPGALMCGVILLCMLAVDSLAGIIVVTLFFGFSSGVFIATPPILFVELTKDKSKVGTRIGMAFAMTGLGVLVGGPGGGAILERTQTHDWTGTWVFAGVFCLASGISFLVLRIWQGGVNVQSKI